MKTRYSTKSAMRGVFRIRILRLCACCNKAEDMNLSVLSKMIDLGKDLPYKVKLDERGRSSKRSIGLF